MSLIASLIYIKKMHLLWEINYFHCLEKIQKKHYGKRYTSQLKTQKEFKK